MSQFFHSPPPSSQSSIARLARVGCLAFAFGTASIYSGVAPLAGADLTSPGSILTGNVNRALLAASDPSVPSQTSAPGSPASLKRPAFFYTNPGPWGKLRCFYIYIEAPQEMVDMFPLPHSKPRWTFPESALPALPGLFKQAGLPDMFAITLLDPLTMIKEGGFVHLFPAIPDIEAMTPAMREVIYPELAKLAENPYYMDPVLITADNVEEWYRTSKLRPDLVSRIAKLSYHRGEALAFSDLSVLMNYASSDAEARGIFKAFTRTRSLMVQLEISDESELPSLLNYWAVGAAGRRKDIEPIMRSVLDTEGSERLGFTHILPALARKLVYTYPGESYSRHGILPDCHWTSLNFFNYEPHEYLLDSRLATSSVLEKFQPVEPPYKYGDVLFFLDAEHGDAFHSCVHLADDLVFTKNGRNALSPWVIMRLPEVQKIYIHHRNGRVQGYRMRPAGS